MSLLLINPTILLNTIFKVQKTLIQEITVFIKHPKVILRVRTQDVKKKQFLK
jgi:hypothetical protein